MKKLSLVSFALLTSSLLFSCGNKTYEYDQSCLFGIDEVICGNDASKDFLDTGVKDYDPDITVDLCKALGAKSLRFRIPKSFITTGNGVINTEVKNFLLELQDKYIEAGVTNLIGSSQWIMPNYLTDGNTVPTRGTDKYLKYLNDTAYWWEQIAKTFPKITKWEIGNETNADFISYEDGENDSDEMRAILNADLMYYVREGLKKGNENAELVMPGLAPIYPSTPITFLEDTYRYIKSGNAPYGRKADKNPDHYFDYLCWHLYVNEDYISKYEKPFKQFNDDIYQVVKDNGDEGTPVYITEFGYSDSGVDIKQEKYARYFKQAFEEFKECPYLESVCVFRLYDQLSSSWGSTAEKYFGLFYEPNETKGLSPKPQAFAIQEAFGGTGDLRKYE